MALVRVLVAVALLALVLQLAGGGVPGDVLVEVHAVLTVVTSGENELKINPRARYLSSLCVVITLASSMNHAGDVF